MYGKQTACAIAALSCLAEKYDGGATRVSASQIAEERDLPRPYLGKILTLLAQAGLVAGSRGPGGGFTLSRAPGRITVYEVYRLFERERDFVSCPFCRRSRSATRPCPFHDQYSGVQRILLNVLDSTTFDGFAGVVESNGQLNGKPVARADRLTG